MAYGEDRSARSLSFAVVDGGRVLGICPLIVEEFGDDEREFSFGGGPCPGPALQAGLSSRHREQVLDRLLSHLDGLAASERVRRATLRRTPLANSFASSGCTVDALLTRGFLDVSLATRVVDLSGRDEASLWRDIRHGHRYDIRRGERSLSVRIVDRSGFHPAMFRSYVDLHRRAAGRVTRSVRTFDLMAEWIQKDLGALFLSLDGDRVIGSAYVILYKDGAFYASAANEPAWEGIPSGHLLQWSILRWLRSRGVRRYELGLQVGAPQLHLHVTPKDTAISLFKRGFGGLTVPLVVVERFYSPAFFRREQAARAHRYAGAIWS